MSPNAVSQLWPAGMGIIAFITLVVFGAGKLPEVGGALGSGIRKFRRGLAGR